MHRPSLATLSRLRRALSTRAGADVADVVVVGGGVAGAALACALRANDATRDLRVVVVDGGNVQIEPRRDDAIDARCVALAPRARAFLEHACDGAWRAIERSGRARAFDAMQVWDGVGGGHATYDARELGAAALGTVVEHRLVLWALERKCEALGVERVSRARATATTTPEEDASGTLARTTVVVDGEGGRASARGRDGTAASGGGGSERTMEIDARLIVAADGPKSATRTAAGIRVGGVGVRATRGGGDGADRSRARDGVAEVLADRTDRAAADRRRDALERRLDDDAERGETISRGRERRRVRAGGARRVAGAGGVRVAVSGRF